MGDVKPQDTVKVDKHGNHAPLTVVKLTITVRKFHWVFTSLI